MKGKSYIPVILALMVGSFGACTPKTDQPDHFAQMFADARATAQTTNDHVLLNKILELWQKEQPDLINDLAISVREGTVILSGGVPRPQMRVDAIRLTWQPDGIKEVVNEIQVEKGAAFATLAKDTAISIQLRSRLTFDQDIMSIHYSIETVDGVIYLMGIAQNQEELDKVIRIANTIKGVKSVVSYVKLNSDSNDDD